MAEQPQFDAAELHALVVALVAQLDGLRREFSGIAAKATLQADQIGQVLTWLDGLQPGALAERTGSAD